MKNIVKFFENITEDMRNWIIANHSNPILWIGIIIVGLLVFGFTYRALQKER